MIKLAPDVFTTQKQNELLLLKIDNDEIVFKLPAFETLVFQSVIKHQTVEKAVQTICETEKYAPPDLTVFAEKLIESLLKKNLVIKVDA